MMQIKSIAAGALLLASYADATQKYKSGGIKTFDSYTYGRFSVRMKASSKKGTISSFFTYWPGPSEGWNEIDIEICASMTNPFSTNIISANQTMD